MGFIADCKYFISDVLHIASTEGVVSFFKNTVANPRYVFEKIAEFDAKGALLNEIDDLVAYLKHPVNKKIFFNKPGAQEHLAELIANANKFGQRSALRHLEDYLTDYVVFRNQQINRPHELLKALVEKHGILTHFQTIETTTQKPLQRQAPEEICEIQPVIDMQPLYQSFDCNGPWQPYLDLEMDELTANLLDLTIDSDPLVPFLESKRIKDCHENLGNIPSIAMMESTLSFRIACDKREIQLMQQNVQDKYEHRNITRKRSLV